MKTAAKHSNQNVAAKANSYAAVRAYDPTGGASPAQSPAPNGAHPQYEIVVIVVILRFMIQR